MSSVRVILLFAALCSVLLVYYLHIPLPQRITERTKMQVLDFIMRLVYYYPMKNLAWLGARSQSLWQRSSLERAAIIIGPWGEDPSLYITNTHMDTVPVRIYEPKQRDNTSDGAILFIHGGGFVIGSLDMYEGMLRDLAKRTGLLTVSIDYRLAPEHVFPAGVEDCERAVAHFLSTAYRRYRVDPNKVVVMGDSAGGNLAAVTSIRLRNNHTLPQLKAQVLLYPLLQFVDMNTPSYQLYYKEYQHTSLLDPESIVRNFLLYLGIEPTPQRVQQVLINNHTTHAARRSGNFEFVRHTRVPEEFRDTNTYTLPPTLEGDPELHALLEPFLFNPDFSPLMHPDLSSLPNAFILTCGYDILRDDGIFYARRLESHGVNVTWQHLEKGFHAMLNFEHLELTDQALGRVASFVRETV